ncbi:MAG: hemin uptake protein HemP [Pseudomonadota bacterium]
MERKQSKPPASSSQRTPRSVPSETLFQGQREVAIVYGNETYLLRITRNDKLILTK